MYARAALTKTDWNGVTVQRSVMVSAGTVMLLSPSGPVIIGEVKPEEPSGVLPAAYRDEAWEL